VIGGAQRAKKPRSHWATQEWGPGTKALRVLAVRQRRDGLYGGRRGCYPSMRISGMLMQRFIARINRKDWWHVPPRDPSAYKKRGQFFASSFREAEFWGRPLDEPQRVRVPARTKLASKLDPVRRAHNLS